MAEPINSKTRGALLILLYSRRKDVKKTANRANNAIREIKANDLPGCRPGLQSSFGQARKYAPFWIAYFKSRLLLSPVNLKSSKLTATYFIIASLGHRTTLQQKGTTTTSGPANILENEQLRNGRELTEEWAQTIPVQSIIAL